MTTVTHSVSVSVKLRLTFTSQDITGGVDTTQKKKPRCLKKHESEDAARERDLFKRETENL